MQEHILDACGLQCPLPLLKTKQQLRQLASGECLHIMATDAGSERDIPAFARLSPHTLKDHHVDEAGVFHFWIVKGEVS